MAEENPNLFDDVSSDEPLAARMRPQTLDEFIGQEHIVGRGRLLRRAIQADMLSSVIFSGPPGTGKTTLAKIIANSTRSQFLTLNAVLSGVKDVRQAIDDAREHQKLYGRRTILFVDEVHRWNKAQQDALLPWVENGTVILIGATTENPFFEVNSALVSRSRVFQLRRLDEDDLRRVAAFALKDRRRGYGAYHIRIDDEALDHLVRVADGDARSVLNALQLAVETTPSQFPPPEGETIHIDLATAEESIQQKALLYDKEGDYHFDTISAFIKSLRGSDPDAALYWLARMVRAGEDPRYLFRRMLILASEDVGMADPNALVVVEAAARAFDRVGMPEGQYHLTQATLYLATAAKSNSSLGYFDALQAVEQEPAEEIPTHLKDPNRDKEGFGHGQGYLYPHAYRNHWVAQSYLPSGLQGNLFYHPSRQGREAEVHDEVERRRELQLAAMQEEEDEALGEVLSFSRSNRSREKWLRRLTEERNAFLADARERIVGGGRLARHSTVLVAGSHVGLLVWEALRRVPEGQVYALVPKGEDRSVLEHHVSQLPELEQPVLLPAGVEQAPTLFATERADDQAHEELPDTVDSALAFRLLYRAPDKLTLLRALASVVSPGGYLSLAEPVPRHGQRLSSFLEARGNANEAGEPSGPEPGEAGPETAALGAGVLGGLKAAEAEIYTAEEDPLFDWDAEDLVTLCTEAGFRDIRTEWYAREERRSVSSTDLRRWIIGEASDAEQGTETSYRAALRRHLNGEQLEELYRLLRERVQAADLPWRTYYLFLTARR